MRLKKLLMLFLVLMISSFVFAEPFVFNPPAFQEGDNEEVVVTVGNMRQALYYKETAELLKDSYNDNQVILKETIKKLSDKEREAKKEKSKKVFYRTAALLTTGLFTYEVLR